MASNPTNPDFYNDLDATLAQLWQRLGRGAADRRSPMHTVQLATVGMDGLPRVRTVVLRGVDRARRQLRIHTDRRSTKVAELGARPAAEVCAYDPRAKIQIRARGAAEILTDGAAEAAWAASQPKSRLCYRAPWPPGTPLADPGDGDISETATEDSDHAGDPGRPRFAVLRIDLTRLEWLYLAASGHRRAAFAWQEDRAWHGRWLAP